MDAVVGAVPAVGAADATRHAPVLTFEIGGTKTAAGVVDAAGRVHSFLVAPTDARGNAQQSLDRLFELGRRAVADSGVPFGDIGAVGIACGGPLDVEAGVLLRPPYLPGWHDVPIAALAEEALGRPAALDNDAAAAAAGELRYGAGAGMRNMVYFTVSTGLGGGVVVDGRLYRGALGNAGELGHVTVDWNGRIWPRLRTARLPRGVRLGDGDRGASARGARRLRRHVGPRVLVRADGGRRRGCGARRRSAGDCGVGRDRPRARGRRHVDRERLRAGARRHRRRREPGR